MANEKQNRAVESVGERKDDALTLRAMPMTRDCIADIREIIVRARRSVVRHVNTTMTLAYWLIGRRIVVEEQRGKRRATYGEHLLERISRELTADFGNGFGEVNLRNFREFYIQNPTEDQIRYALRSELSWTHHRAILRVSEAKARAYYLREAASCGWNTRELERQIRMFSYERVVSNHAEIEKPQTSELTAAQLLRDPCVAEFLNLKENLRGKEKKVEKRILKHIEKFMLELGKGFTLAGSQYRVPLDSTEKFIDLVFYNYLLRCFVLVDLKTKRLTSRDIGQMDAYRRIFDALKRPDGDNPTIGMLLCTEVNEEDVKYSVMAECEQMFAVKLLPYMPSKEELIFEIERSRGRIATRKSSSDRKRIDCQKDVATKKSDVS